MDTTFEEFRRLSTKGNFVPVSREVMADVLTPVSAFLKVANASDRAFLFESVVGGERLARYSFLGKDPFVVIRSVNGETLIERDATETVVAGEYSDELRKLMSRYVSPPVDGLPRFSGGGVGYFGYDTAAWFEPSLKETHSSRKKKRDSSDTASFMMFDTILAFDHVRHRILIIANALVQADDDDENARLSYESVCSKLDVLENELTKELSEPSVEDPKPLNVKSNTTQEAYEDAVRKAKEYIKAGDIFQVVLSQRFESRVTADPFSVYRSLRHINPSPYMYFIRLGDTAIVGASPEMLVRVEGDRAETHPIAGTRPRGNSEDEDSKLAAELIANEKERAEHVMLVDLGRNDLGRVSEYGTVKVEQFMGLEKYSHVMHLVSRVTGILSNPNDRLDALAACFPAGTVSGAPKIRAMEIIEELEPDDRGIYAGAVGYLDFRGNLDCCITIRTIVMKDGIASIQAGAGIVADSVPSAEYEETCAKASALLRALEMAEARRGPGGRSSGTGG